MTFFGSIQVKNSTFCSQFCRDISQRGGDFVGLFDFFGGGCSTPKNEAEKEAMVDYIADAVETGKDPVPKEPPSWAETLPNPKEGK